MNIVYLNHYAGSPALGMEYRPYYLAREWVRAGHRVQMLAASYSHVRARQPVLRGTVPDKVVDEAVDEDIDGIAYRWYPTPAYQGNGVGRVWNIARFLLQVAADTPRLVRDFRPDAVIASSTYPLDIWPARRMARRASALLVHEVHDLWPLSPIELGGLSPAHPFIRLCQWAEDTACRDADRVVSMLPCVHQHLAAHGLDLRRLVIVPNGIDPAEWDGAPQPLSGSGDAGPGDAGGAVADALARARAAGATIVGYAGSHGLPNALDTLLDVAAALRDEAFQFVLVGDGHEKPRLAARVAAEGLANVHLCPPIPKAQVPAFLAALDIAYIGWQRVPIYRFGIAPNKLMDYMMAGCAVLHAVDAGNDPVADAQCGVSVPPDDVPAIAAGLRSLAAAGADARRAMGARGRAYVQAHHTYPVLAERFVQALVDAKAEKVASNEHGSTGADT